MTKKSFDFNSADFLRYGQSYREFLQSVYHTAMTEDEFVEKYRSFSHGQGHRSPSYARAKYRHLQKNFDFFSTT